MTWEVCEGTLIAPAAIEAEYWQPVPQPIVAAVDHEYAPAPTLPKEMLVPVLASVFPLKVTLHEVPADRPLSVNVTEYVVNTKFAVIVPAPLTVAVVAALVDEAKLTEPVDDHEEKVYPDAGEALIKRLPPALTHVFVPVVGVVVPLEAGLTAMVIWNCFE